MADGPASVLPAGLDPAGILPWLGVLDVLRASRVNTAWRAAADAEARSRTRWVYQFEEALAPSAAGANGGIEGIEGWKVYNSGDKIVFNSKGGPRGFSLVGVKDVLSRVDFLPLFAPGTRDVLADVYRAVAVFRPTQSCDVLLQGLECGTLGETGFGVRITKTADSDAGGDYTLDLVRVGAGGDPHPFWSTTLKTTMQNNYFLLDLFYSAAPTTEGGVSVVLSEYDTTRDGVYESSRALSWSRGGARPGASTTPLFCWSLATGKHQSMPAEPCLVLASTDKLYVTHVSVVGGYDIPPEARPRAVSSAPPTAAVPPEAKKGKGKGKGKGSGGRGGGSGNKRKKK